MPPKKLFSFESADFLQIGKSVCMAPEVDVFPFHIIGPHIQPDKFFKASCSSAVKESSPLPSSRAPITKILAFQFLHLGLDGIFRAGSRQIHHDVAVDFRKLLGNALREQAVAIVHLSSSIYHHPLSRFLLYYTCPAAQWQMCNHLSFCALAFCLASAALACSCTVSHTVSI